MAQPIASILDVFDLVVVINLDHRKDRLREVSKQLRDVGLDFTMPRVVRLSASQFESRGQFPSIGARGCFESHVRALDLALAHGAQSVLVLEDDCDFADTIATVMARLAREDWSIAYVGFVRCSTPLETGGLFEVPPVADIMCAHCVGWRGPDVIAAAAAYLRAIAARAVNDPDGGPMHVDGAYGWFRRAHPGLRTLIANPPAALQRSSRSDIASLKWFDRTPVVRQVAAAARRIRRA